MLLPNNLLLRLNRLGQYKIPASLIFCNPTMPDTNTVKAASNLQNDESQFNIEPVDEKNSNLFSINPTDPQTVQTQGKNNSFEREKFMNKPFMRFLISRKKHTNENKSGTQI